MEGVSGRVINYLHPYPPLKGEGSYGYVIKIPYASNVWVDNELYVRCQGVTRVVDCN